MFDVEKKLVGVKN